MSRRSLFVRGYFKTEIFKLIAAVGLMAGLGLVFSGTGCGGQLGGDCIRTGDCKPGLICAFQFCTQQCTDSRDCTATVDPAASCVVATGDALGDDMPPDTKINVCQKPIECGNNGVACASGQRCGDTDNICAADCTDLPCPGFDRCFHGTCRAETNPPKSGFDTPARNGFPCNADTDCTSLNCNWRGICALCRLDQDCEALGMLYCECANIDTGQCITEKPKKPCEEVIDAESSGGTGGAGGGTGSSSGAGGA